MEPHFYPAYKKQNYASKQKLTCNISLNKAYQNRTRAVLTEEYNKKLKCNLFYT